MQMAPVFDIEVILAVMLPCVGVYWVVFVVLVLVVGILLVLLLWAYTLSVKLYVVIFGWGLESLSII
jgi:hypothetical protein